MKSRVLSKVLLIFTLMITCVTSVLQKIIISYWSMVKISGMIFYSKMEFPI